MSEVRPWPAVATLNTEIRAGKRSVTDVAEQVLANIDAREAEVGAFLHLDAENIRAQATQLQKSLQQSSEVGPLFGVPVALKDNFATRHAPTTCASGILKDYRPPYDAHVVDCLRKAGALLVGKTNLDEFAMGSSTEHSAYQATRNPLDTTRVPGGSSGGSAAAVSAGFVPLALGSDTGGSIRQPAAFCGVTGLKPTYGRVSRFGLVAFASSLDQIGTFSHGIEDAIPLLQAIAAPDARDSTCLQEAAPDYAQTVTQVAIDGLRIGIPKEAFPDALGPRMSAAVRSAAALLENAGATLVEVSLPHSEVTIATYCLIAFCEASSNLARYEGVHYGLREDGASVDALMRASRGAHLGAEVKRRILLGTFALSAGYADQYYLQAQKVRTLIRQDYEGAFADADLLLTPTTPGLPFTFNSRSDPVQMYMEDLFTVGPSLAGLPALSMPCAEDSSGLRVSAQLLAPPWQEARLLAGAAALQHALGETLPSY